MKCPSVRSTFFYIFVSALLTGTAGCDSNKTFSVETETIKVDSLSQIIPLNGPWVRPVLYSHVKGLSDLPSPESKEKFVAVVLPAILVARNEIDNLGIRIKMLNGKARWDKADSAVYTAAKIKFKAKDMEDLAARIGTLPNSIVLAQAAVETGWGTSRFFLEANNLFGVWSFNSNEPRIAAGINRREKTIYIRSYENMSESIVHYFEVLGSARAYRSLRKTRQTETNPFELLPHLRNYSERRTRYTNLLKELILQNELTVYDPYQIDPNYLHRD